MPAVPSPGDAARALDEISALGGRSRRVATSAFVGWPLVLWGAAWLAGYAALDLLSWSVAVPLGVVLAAGALTGSVLGRSSEVVSGWERQLQLSWLAVAVTSPVLVLVVTPLPAQRVALLLGALWGLALLLYAVASRDGALAGVGIVVVAAAGVVRFAAGDHDLLAFGVVAGIAMAGLGAVRLRGLR